MYRFFVPMEQISEAKAVILGDDVNHIKNVLRMKSGEKVMLSDGQGKDYYCIIEDIQAEKIEVTIEEIHLVKTELPVRMILFQALPKADKMELIIQKAVELGVCEVVPVRTKRCVVKLDDAKAAKKVKRWQGIAEAASKQSGRGIVPNVHDVMSWTEAMEYARTLEKIMIPYELYDGMSESLETVRRAAKSESIGIFIGPEGGFERTEVEAAMEAGAIPISLGRRILRTETAGLAILSVLMFEIESDWNGRE